MLNVNDLSLDEKIELTHKLLCSIADDRTFPSRNIVASMGQVAHALLMESMRRQATKKKEF